MKFRTTLELGGKTATGIRVPDEVVAALDAGKRPPVNVTVNGHTYRSTIGARGGSFMIPVSAEHRAAAGIAAGDEIDVEVEVDTEPREVTVPDDFGAALGQAPAARAAYDKLSYSHQRQWVLSIEDAKTPETRQRRIDKAVAALGG